MKITPLKVIQMTILFIVFSILFSCSKDSDLLLDSVLNESEVSVEEKNGATEIPAEEEGFVIRTFEFSPTNDAYLQDTQGHDQSIIRLQEDFRTSFLMFDLNDVNGIITDVVLQFSVDSDEGDGSIAIHKGTSVNWTEENLTVNNAPSVDIQLGTMNKSYKVGAPEKVALDATGIRPEITTLVLKHSTGNDLAFASKEHPNNKGPKLIVTYQAVEGSPLIEQDSDDTAVATQEDEENTTPEEVQPTNDNQTPTAGYFVTVNGSASSDGRSEANAWSIEHAFDRAVAGDVVYIKAGNYGSKELIADNSGNASNPIKFIGYTNTPGDIVSNQGSTFKYGDNLDSQKMPLIKGLNSDDIGLDIPENYVEIHNFQVTDYQHGIIAKGLNVILKNIVVSDIGLQSDNSKQNGKGIHIYGNNTVVENCFVLNANSEGINIKGASGCTLKNSNVYSDNIKNPTGYYILVSDNGKSNTIENCIAYRDPQASLHQGHGMLVKDIGSNNIFKGCKTYNTGYEVNFSGVTNNTFENCSIYGEFSDFSNQYSTCIAVLNGAQNNIFKDFYIEDAHWAIRFRDFNDGYSGDVDRDEKEGGHNNKFINITVNKAKNIVIGESVEVGASAFSENNSFTACIFKNITGVPFFSYQTIKNTEFLNCSFENIPSDKILNSYNGGSFQMTFEDCSFTNVGFPIPI